MGPSDPFCTNLGYPPIGAWYQSGCVCVAGGARGCKYHTSEKPYFSTIECTDGACYGSTCTITCDTDYIMRGCQGLKPCQRSCGQSGYWSPAMTDGPEFQPRCVPGLPAVADALHGRAESSSSVALQWLEPINSPDSMPSRQWTIFGSRVNTEYQYGHKDRLIDDMESRTEKVACVPQEDFAMQLCSLTYSGLQPNTLYSFAVQGSNLAGEGPRSVHVQVSTTIAE